VLVNLSGGPVESTPGPAKQPGTTYPNTYDTNIPGATGANGYADASLAANTAYKNTLARINQKRSSTLRQAGYLGDIDPTSGMLSNLRVDAYNPYGGLQSMLRGQAGDFQQAQYAAEDRGLHGGLAHKADSELKYQHGAAGGAVRLWPHRHARRVPGRAEPGRVHARLGAG
jgi:hypothetical protein